MNRRMNISFLITFFLCKHTKDQCINTEIFPYLVVLNVRLNIIMLNTVKNKFPYLKKFGSILLYNTLHEHMTFTFYLWKNVFTKKEKKNNFKHAETSLKVLKCTKALWINNSNFIRLSCSQATYFFIRYCLLSSAKFLIFWRIPLNVPALSESDQKT